MKYTFEKINRMSWQEWNETMVKELNENGFKTKEFNDNLGKWTMTGQYNAGDDPKLFILGEIDDSNAISYLKKVGLLNNGRCPMCGKTIYGKPGRFTSGFDSEFHFQICQDCVNPYGRSKAQSRGCVITLFLFPWHIVKEFIINM